MSSKEVYVKDGTTTVLRALQDDFTDWMHACGGKGRCTTCKMVVLKGMEFASPLSEAELKYKGRDMLYENERLACQTTICGDIEVLVPDESKMPHVTYS